MVNAKDLTDDFKKTYFKRREENTICKFTRDNGDLWVCRAVPVPGCKDYCIDHCRDVHKGECVSVGTEIIKLRLQLVEKELELEKLKELQPKDDLKRVVEI